MSMFGHYMDYTSKVCNETIENFILRLTRNSSMTFERMAENCLSMIAFPRDYAIDDDKELPYPAPKLYDPHLAHKERQLISLVLSLDDISWDVILDSCTYNNAVTIAPLKRYYQSPSFIRNAVNVINVHIESPELSDFLSIAPFQAFQFRFLDYPDSVKRHLEVVMQGLLNTLYSRLDELNNKKTIPQKFMDNFCCIRRKNIDDMISEWKKDMLKEESAHFVGTIFNAENDSEYIHSYEIGEKLALVEIMLRMFKYGYSLEEIEFYIHPSKELYAIMAQIEYISDGSSSKSISIYNKTGRLETI